MNTDPLNLKTPLAPRRTFHHRTNNPVGSNTDGESVRYRGEIVEGYFLMVNPDGSNVIIPLTSGELKIGRRVDNDIVIKHNYISRFHASCIVKDGMCQFKSLSSTNFTQINGEKMRRGKYYEVQPCIDVVNMMGFVFRFFRTPIQLSNSLNRFPRRKTGIYLDIRVCLHSNPHDPNHPESPNRIFQIESMLEKHPQFMNRCVRLSKRFATDDELALCHTRNYIEKVKHMKINPGMGGNIFMNQYTPQAAYLSCGGVINLVEKVCTGELENGFAFIRPPGHHASRNKAMGFCFFNNVAVAARVASKKYNKKVVIVDWDVHHGNGTNQILGDDDRIIYFSTHRYGNFFPGTGEIDDVGRKKGKGFNVNIPFPFGYNNQDELYSFFQILMPIMLEFGPDIVIVSAGFDAVIDDPLGGCFLSPEVYGVLTSLLKSVTKHVILALEGGYNVHQTAKCCLECIKVLVGENPSKIPEEEMDPRNRQTEVLINASKRHLSPYWRSIVRPPDPKPAASRRIPQQQQLPSSHSSIIHGPPASHAAAFFMNIPPIPPVGQKPPPPPTPTTPIRRTSTEVKVVNTVNGRVIIKSSPVQANQPPPSNIVGGEGLVSMTTGHGGSRTQRHPNNPSQSSVRLPPAPVSGQRNTRINSLRTLQMNARNNLPNTKINTLPSLKNLPPTIGPPLLPKISALTSLGLEKLIPPPPPPTDQQQVISSEKSTPKKVSISPQRVSSSSSSSGNITLRNQSSFNNYNHHAGSFTLLKKRKRFISPMEMMMRKKRKFASVAKRLNSGIYVRTITPSKILSQNNQRGLTTSKNSMMPMKSTEVFSEKTTPVKKDNDNISVDKESKSDENEESKKSV